MRQLRAWWLRFAGLFHKEQQDCDLAEELACHLQMHIEDNLRSGMSPVEARRDALIKLGGIEQTKEKVRERRGFPFIESVLQDVSFGLRMFRKNPGFTAVAILTLALGIGANTAIFSVINGLLLHPAGISDPSRLVMIMTKYDKLNMKSIPVVSPPDFADVRDSRDVFSSAAIMKQDSFNYSGGAVPERLIGAQVSWQWFEVFGVEPLIGRVFRPEEDQPDANREVILSYGTWKSLFGGDTAIVGKTIELNRQPYRVVGVMGRDFATIEAQLWVPLGLPPGAFAADNHFNENLIAVARIRPDVPLAKAEAFVPVLAQHIADTVPHGADAKNAGWGLFALPLTEGLFGDLRMPMFVLLGAVGFVLLIACTNIASLMLAKASSREREFAVRAALGSTRWRVTRQALTESLLLAGAGMFLGLLLANYGVELLLRFAPEDIAQSVQFRVDGYVLAFVAATSLLSGILFGVVPAWHVAGPDQFESLKEGGRSGTASRERQRLRSLLVVSEVALALILLVGAGLFLKSFVRMQQVNPGFNSHSMMTAAVSLPATQFDTPEKQDAFYQAVLKRLANMPGVTAASSSWPLPFTNQLDAGGFDIEGRTFPPGAPAPHANRQRVSPSYFSAMKIPLRAGRYFTDDDRTQAVVIIDEDLAHQFWPNEEAVGKRLRPDSSLPWATIIGVVGTVGYRSSLTVSMGKGLCYYQAISPALPPSPVPSAFLIARTTADPVGQASAIRGAVHEADPNVPVYDLKTMDQRLGDSLGPQRLIVWFLGSFSAIAILLASLGLYGLLNYSVTQRTQEMGIRIALGAQRREVFTLVISHALRLIAVGILFGTLGAMVLARLISSQLFQTSAFDPFTFVAMGIVLMFVAFAACYIPARRATRVDPMVALRYE